MNQLLRSSERAYLTAGIVLVALAIVCLSMALALHEERRRREVSA